MRNITEIENQLNSWTVFFEQLKKNGLDSEIETSLIYITTFLKSRFKLLNSEKEECHVYIVQNLNETTTNPIVKDQRKNWQEQDYLFDKDTKTLFQGKPLTPVHLNNRSHLFTALNETRVAKHTYSSSQLVDLISIPTERTLQANYEINTVLECTLLAMMGITDKKAFSSLQHLDDPTLQVSKAITNLRNVLIDKSYTSEYNITEGELTYIAETDVARTKEVAEQCKTNNGFVSYAQTNSLFFFDNKNGIFMDIPQNLFNQDFRNRIILKCNEPVDGKTSHGLILTDEINQFFSEKDNSRMLKEARYEGLTSLLKIEMDKMNKLPQNSDLHNTTKDILKNIKAAYKELGPAPYLLDELNLHLQILKNINKPSEQSKENLKKNIYNLIWFMQSPHPGKKAASYHAWASLGLAFLTAAILAGGITATILAPQIHSVAEPGLLALSLAALTLFFTYLFASSTKQERSRHFKTFGLDLEQKEHMQAYVKHVSIFAASPDTDDKSNPEPGLIEGEDNKVDTP